MVVMRTDEPRKRDFIDYLILSVMSVDVAAIVAYRFFTSSARFQSARNHWDLVSRNIVIFADNIHPGYHEPGCDISLSTHEKFNALLVELSVALGLYEDTKLESSVPEHDGDDEDTLVHAADQLAGKDSPMKWPNLNSVLPRTLSNLRSFALNLYSKLRESKSEITQLWLQAILDLDRAIDEARRDGMIDFAARHRLESRLDDIVDEYHAILMLHPFE
ncbi:hypothetical protein ONZ45_g5058 [Pleurotus djamor]|nr:hypothetical protein ONZ45_g5058 [Pleurotus djamor]